MEFVVTIVVAVFMDQSVPLNQKRLLTIDLVVTNTEALELID